MLLPKRPFQTAPQDSSNPSRLNLPAQYENDQQSVRRGILERSTQRQNEAYFRPKVEVAGKLLGSLGAPQRKMMQGLTGSEQTPGEYLVKKGYLSPDAGGLKGLLGSAGKVAADVVVDPMNLVGAGVARKIAGAGKAVEAASIVGKTEKLGMAASAKFPRPGGSEEQMSKLLGMIEPPVKPYPYDWNTKPVLENMRTRMESWEGRMRMRRLDRSDVDLQNLNINATTERPAYYTSAHTTMDGATFMPKKINPGVYLHPGLPDEMVPNITRHEIQHHIQSGVPLQLDEDLGKLDLHDRPNEFGNSLAQTTGAQGPQNSWDKARGIAKTLGNRQEATDYFTHGGRGNAEERSAFLSELQQHMMNKGVMPADKYVNVTPQMVHDVYHGQKPGDYPLRILNIAKPTEANFTLLANALNRMPAVGAGVVGAAAVGAGAQRKAKGGLLPGKLTMLGPDGKAQMELGGGNRIFSRANTRELVSRSQNAKTPAELKELGSRIKAMLDQQDRNKPEYVNE